MKLRRKRHVKALKAENSGKEDKEREETEKSGRNRKVGEKKAA